MYVNSKTSPVSILEIVFLFLPMLAFRWPCHSQRKRYFNRGVVDFNWTKCNAAFHPKGRIKYFSMTFPRQGCELHTRVKYIWVFLAQEPRINHALPRRNGLKFYHYVVPCKVGWIIISFLLTTWDFVANVLRDRGIAVKWCLCIHKIVATFTRGPYSAYSVFTIAFCWGTHACKRTIRAARTKCTQECSPESGCGSSRYQCLCDGSCGFSCVEKG